jgi:hypothetical protein
MDKLAKSLAGHDKDHVYAVVNEDERDVYLVDGKSRTLDRPKRKNRIHVQMITHLPEEYAQLLDSVDSDSDLVHALRVYHSAVPGAEQ